MKNVKIAVFVVLALILSMVFSSCTSFSATNTNIQKADWVDHTRIPSKDYIVLGAVVIRTTNPKTLNADLMDKAIQMGGHDIINVRLDTEEAADGRRILAVSAVVIKYLDQTLKLGEGETVILGTGSASSVGSNEPPRQKFLGIF
jgi:hypothetical protein